MRTSNPESKPTIFIDADACPVKDETLRVAARHGLKVTLVSDGGIRPYQDPNISVITVAQGADAADDWIATHIEAQDICITADTPLAARCLQTGAHALRPNGEPFTPQNIGMALATRDLMQGLRDTGQISGGPRPFSKADRSKFLNRLEVLVQQARREAATNRKIPAPN